MDRPAIQAGHSLTRNPPPPSSDQPSKAAFISETTANIATLTIHSWSMWATLSTGHGPADFRHDGCQILHEWMSWQLVKPHSDAPV